MLLEFDIEVPAGVKVIASIGFMDFLKAESNAMLVLTDSCGVQEERCILDVPCVTIRENIERPETVEIGANIIACYEHQRIINAAITMLKNND